MRRLLPFIGLLALLVAAPAASAQSRHPNAPPVLLGPQDGREFPPPLRAVTLRVKGLRHERPNALRIQFTDADATVDRTGRFHSEGGVDDYPLEQVRPGGVEYAVTVPAEAFRRYSDKSFYWQAYRLVPRSDCRRMRGTTRRDCFQQSTQTREFRMIEPTGYLNFEPNNTAATATTEFLNSDCAFLEKTNDVDWFRHAGTPEPHALRVRLTNWADTDRWKPLGPKSRERADMSVTVYEEEGVRSIASIHVPVGEGRVLKTQLEASKAYLIAVAHAGNGFPNAKPAANLYYRFTFNFPSEFDFAGCG